MNPFPGQNGGSFTQIPGGQAPFRRAAEATPTRGRGRPAQCTPQAVDALKGLIRELGLSDSAAAVRLGFGASTVSRWKREDPEVRAHLEQAREECRSLQLNRIMESAAAENGRGWRAAAWLLERLFPEDYAASAGVREGHRQVAERRRQREEETSAGGGASRAVPGFLPPTCACRRSRRRKISHPISRGEGRGSVGKRDGDDCPCSAY